MVLKLATALFTEDSKYKCLNVFEISNIEENENGQIFVKQNGSAPKFVDKVASISFSSKRARVNGQKVLYVTERCVFELTDKGLKLIEVYPGIDLEKDIISLLPFSVEIDESLL